MPSMTAARMTLLLWQLVQPPCVPSRTEQLLPELVGPATGGDPVWLVDGSNDHFDAGPIKTLWIFKTRARVRIRGHELATGAATRFQHHGPESPISSEMVIEDPSRESVIPGGATRDVLTVYAFTPSYVFYPHRGCYQFDADVDGGTRHITIELK
jgi:hypothetical protein